MGLITKLLKNRPASLLDLEGPISLLEALCAKVIGLFFQFLMHSVECQSVKVKMKRAAVCQNGGCCYHGFGIKTKKRTVEDQKGHCTKELF